MAQQVLQQSPGKLPRTLLPTLTEGVDIRSDGARLQEHSQNPLLVHTLLCKCRRFCSRFLPAGKYLDNCVFLCLHTAKAQLGRSLLCWLASCLRLSIAPKTLQHSDIDAAAAHVLIKQPPPVLVKHIHCKISAMRLACQLSYGKAAQLET